MPAVDPPVAGKAVVAGRRGVEQIAARLLGRWARRYAALAGAGLVLALLATYLPSVAPTATAGGAPLGTAAFGGGAAASRASLAVPSTSGGGGLGASSALAASDFGTAALGGASAALGGPSAADSGIGSVTTGGTGGGTTGGTGGGTGVPTPPSSGIPPCPLPLPNNSVPPASLGSMLSALGPVLTLAGPLDTSILGIVPIVAPLLPVVGPLLGASGPYEGPLNTLADALAPVLAPAESALVPPAQAGSPAFAQVANALTPLLTAAADTPIMGCVGALVNTFAAAIPLPGGSGSSGSSGGSGGGALPALASPSAGSPPVLAQQVPWSAGLTSSDRAAIASLAARHVPIMIDLVGQPPPGATAAGPGFAQWVAAMVRSLPQVSIWQVGGPSDGPVAAGTASAMVAALEAADQNRTAGQFVGIDVPSSDPAAANMLRSAVEALGRSLNFVGMGFATAAGAPPTRATAGLQQMVAAARRQTLPGAGVPGTVPIFVTAVGNGGSPAASAESLSAAASAVRGLGVGLLAWGVGDAVGGSLAAALTSPESRP